MKSWSLLFSIILLFTTSLFAQISITQSQNVNFPVDAGVKQKLVAALDTLLYHINQGKSDPSKIEPNGAALSISMFKSLKGMENNEKAKDSHFYKPQLVNLYMIEPHRYFVSIAYIGDNSLRAIVDFIASDNTEQVTFAIPLLYLTKTWKTTKVGRTTYHYPDHLDLNRAKKFDQNQARIAQKLGLLPEAFDFYLVNNYQEILPFLGYMFDSESVGKVSDGYGVNERTIFSIKHNEDFSHDTFHYYAAKIRTNPRNSAADEGFAYSWGNAYYTDEHGEMITQQQLVPLLKEYLKVHPEASLLDLFIKNPPVFPYQTKVRSLIASLICDEVERRKGIAGAKALLNCGRGDDNFFKAVNDMIGINLENSDVELRKLLLK